MTTHAQNVIAMREAIRALREPEDMNRQPGLYMALLRAERAKVALNHACRGGAPLPDEDTFGALEEEASITRQALGNMLAEITGLPTQRIVEAFL